MKLMIYGIGKKELPVAREWAQNNHYQIEVTEQELTSETVDLAKGADAVSFQQMRPLKEEAIYQSLKENGVRYLSTRSAGIDGLNQNFLTKYQLKAANVPVYSPRAIAEYALTLTMMLLRNQPKLEKRRENGSFVLDGLIGREIHALTVGIVGTGHIGLATAELFHALGARVIGYDHYPKEEIETLTYYNNLEELIKEADVVSLHTPYFPENHHLMNEKMFSLMKSDAILINTARGPIVDTQALIHALQTGEIAGAALDTLENEERFVNKMADKRVADPHLEELLQMDNVIVSPHIAFYTLQASKKLMEASLKSLDEFLTTGRSASQIN